MKLKDFIDKNYGTERGARVAFANDNPALIYTDIYRMIKRGNWHVDLKSGRLYQWDKKTVALDVHLSQL